MSTVTATSLFRLRHWTRWRRMESASLHSSPITNTSHVSILTGLPARTELPISPCPWQRRIQPWPSCLRGTATTLRHLSCGLCSRHRYQQTRNHSNPKHRQEAMAGGQAAVRPAGVARLAVRLTGSAADKYTVIYQCGVSQIGPSARTFNGDYCGANGHEIEQIKVWVTAK
jgi:hypothetical protein